MEHPEDRCSCNPAQIAHDTNCPKWDTMVDHTVSAGAPLEVKKKTPFLERLVFALFLTFFCFPIVCLIGKFWIDFVGRLIVALK